MQQPQLWRPHHQGYQHEGAPSWPGSFASCRRWRRIGTVSAAAAAAPPESVIEYSPVIDRIGGRSPVRSVTAGRRCRHRWPRRRGPSGEQRDGCGQQSDQYRRDEDHKSTEHRSFDTEPGRAPRCHRRSEPEDKHRQGGQQTGDGAAPPCRCLDLVDEGRDGHHRRPEVRRDDHDADRGHHRGGAHRSRDGVWVVGRRFGRWGPRRQQPTPTISALRSGGCSPFAALSTSTTNNKSPPFDRRDPVDGGREHRFHRWAP